MNIIITGHHYELKNGLKNFITEKVNNKLSPFSSRIHKVSIVLTPEKDSFKCDCDITSDFGEIFASSTEIFEKSAVDKTLHKILTEITKKHDKIVTHTKTHSED